MARANTVQEYRTFVRGIITEANALTFPKDASIDEENFILNRDGSRRRRLGMDYELEYQLSSDIQTSLFSERAVSSHTWRNAANSGLHGFAVVQVGNRVLFYDNTQADISNHKHAFEIDLEDYKSPTASATGFSQISVASGKGGLFIVSRTTEPLVVVYNPVTDTFSVETITILVRDFSGVDDGLDVDENPLTLTPLHNYNLRNQGWTESKIVQFYNQAYLIPYKRYPNNAQIWTEGRDVDNNFSPDELIKLFFGTTPAPKGHYILENFSKDRSSASGVAGLPSEVESSRPETVAFYSGRAWFSGIQSGSTSSRTMNGDIYYSKILDNYLNLANDAGKCFQEADPTSEDISDLVDTDGGVITIPEAGVIHRLVPVRDSLVVIADNGVWQISGDMQSGFTATSNQVIKITNIGTKSKSSVVVVDDSVLFWAEEGIYAVGASEDGRSVISNSITDATIQTLYQEIPGHARLHAVGSFDPTDKKIYWSYNDTDGYDGVSYVNKYNVELVLDLNLGAFSKNRIGEIETRSPYVAGYIVTPSMISGTRNLDIVVGANSVEVGIGNQVYVEVGSQTRGAVSTKYLTVVPQVGGLNSKVTFSHYRNSNFIDWKTFNSVGIDQEAFVITGHELFGDTMRRKQVPFIIVHCRQTETGFINEGGVGLNYENPSSCRLQARWEFADHGSSNKWSQEQEVYRLHRLYIPEGVGSFDYGFSTVTTKSKVRGRGRSVSLRFRSSPSKDLHLLGWGVSVLGETDV